MRDDEEQFIPIEGPFVSGKKPALAAGLVDGLGELAVGTVGRLAAALKPVADRSRRDVSLLCRLLLGQAGDKVLEDRFAMRFEQLRFILPFLRS